MCMGTDGRTPSNVELRPSDSSCNPYLVSAELCGCRVVTAQRTAAAGRAWARLSCAWHKHSQAVIWAPAGSCAGRQDHPAFHVVRLGEFHRAPRSSGCLLQSLAALCHAGVLGLDNKTRLPQPVQTDPAGPVSACAGAIPGQGWAHMRTCAAGMADDDASPEAAAEQALQAGRQAGICA